MRTPFLHLICALLVPAAALAGGNVENGGVGVISEGKIHTLELVERGIELAPFTSETWEISPEVRALTTAFVRGRNVPAEATAILERKIERIRRRHAAAMWIGVSTSLKSFTLALVNAPLRTIPDRLSPIDPRVLVQLAVHGNDNNMIQVNAQGFAQMDAANQAALLLHELIYSSTQDNTSRPSRQVNGILFDPASADDAVTDRYAVAKARRWGQACIERSWLEACEAGVSSPEVILFAEIARETIEAYRQLLPPAITGSAREFTWFQAFGPYFTKNDSWGGTEYHDTRFTFYPKGADAFISSGVTHVNEPAFVREHRYGLADPTQFAMMSGDKSYPKDKSWDDRVGKLQIEGGHTVKARTRDNRSAAELSLVRLPNGKYFYVSRFTHSTIGSKYPYAFGVLGATP